MERCWQLGHLEKILAGYQWWLRSSGILVGCMNLRLYGANIAYNVINKRVLLAHPHPCLVAISKSRISVLKTYSNTRKCPKFLMTSTWWSVISQKHHVTCPSVHRLRRTDHWNQFMFFFALLHSLLDVGSYPLASILGLVLLFEALSQIQTNLLWDPFAS